MPHLQVGYRDTHPHLLSGNSGRRGGPLSPGEGSGLQERGERMRGASHLIDMHWPLYLSSELGTQSVRVPISESIGSR